MSPLKPLLRSALVAASAAALASCVTVFPESEPAQLYRFGTAAAPLDDVAPPAGHVGVLKSQTGFARAISGDKILTITGDKAAYIAEARWVAPASVLFDEAVAHAFDENSGSARLVVRGEASRSAYRLRLDVRSFEAVYDQGQRRAPTIVVRMRAVLTHTSDRALAGEQLFEVRVKADTNRVSSIVDAFDEATAEAVSQLVAWTNEHAKPEPEGET